MKRFQFKLDALLTIRERQEYEALRVLADRQRILMNEQNKKNILEKDLKNSIMRRENLSEKTAMIQEYRVEDVFIQGQKKRIEFSVRSIQRAEKWVNQAMMSYFVARQRKNVIDKLKEKAKFEYKVESSKKEQKALDDIYVMRNVSKLMEGDRE